MASVAIGVTAASSEMCKRGLAVNLAAAIAYLGHDVVLLDGDPDSDDVGTRLGIDGPSASDLMELARSQEDLQISGAIHRLADPPLGVVPIGTAATGDVCEDLLFSLRRGHEAAVVDLPVVGRNDSMAALPAVNRLIIAMTPDRPSVAATRHYLATLATAVDRGRLPLDLSVGVVTTGDEGSTVLEPEEAADLVDGFAIGHVPQWWGRSRPNRGFGPTVRLEVLDLVLHPLAERIVAGDLPRLGLLVEH